MSRVLHHATNIAVLLFIGYALLRPSGPVRQWWESRRSEAARSEALQRLWPQLAERAMRASQDTLVEILDYQCPFCRRMHAALRAAEENGLFTVAVIHFPIRQLHPRAEDASMAVICAEARGDGRALHDHLLETEEWMTPGVDWSAVITRAGIEDAVDLLDCMESALPRQRLSTDSAIAVDLGVRATPSFVGRGGFHSGAATIEELLELLPR